MTVKFGWGDEAHTVMRYTAEGQWNWKDYHRAVRVSLFALRGVDHPVHSILDLTHTDILPRGALPHLITVGAKKHPCLSGYGVVIGLDHQIEGNLLQGKSERVLRMGEQVIHFVDNETDARIVLDSFGES
jgi:hypothetical protein